MTKLAGYVIVSMGHPPAIRLRMAYGSFALTAVEAWCRHLNRSPIDPEFSTLVRRHSEYGYRPVKTDMIMEEPVKC